MNLDPTIKLIIWRSRSRLTGLKQDKYDDKLTFQPSPQCKFQSTDCTFQSGYSEKKRDMFILNKTEIFCSQNLKL